MNVRLEYNFDFLAATYLHNELLMNKYFVFVDMITQSDNSYEQNVALDRIRYIINHHFRNCIFVHTDDAEKIEKFQSANLNVVTLPEVPVDQIIGIMLYSKLNAIAEQRLFITELKINSELGEYLVYKQDDEEDLGPLEYVGWWHDSEPNSIDKSTNKSKIVRLEKVLTWDDIGLGWQYNPDVNNSSVLAFNKDD